MVELALIRSLLRRSCRNAAIPASSSAATPSTRARPLRDYDAFGGQAGSARGTVHQRDAGLRFHGADARRDCLLSDAGVARGAVQAARPGHAEQHFQRREDGHVRTQRHQHLTRYKPGPNPVKPTTPC